MYKVLIYTAIYDIWIELRIMFSKKPFKDQIGIYYNKQIKEKEVYLQRAAKHEKSYKGSSLKAFTE